MKRLVLLAATLLLGGCGGGIYLGWSDYDDDGSPSVSIATAQASVSAGGVLRVVAAASDDASGIDEVAFYRVDGATDTRLGSDGSAPYEWSVPVPADGRTTVSVFARARDGAGNSATSALLTIGVTP